MNRWKWKCEDIYFHMFITSGIHYTSTGRGAKFLILLFIRKVFFPQPRINKLSTRLLERHSMLSFKSLKFVDKHVEITRMIWSIDLTGLIYYSYEFMGSFWTFLTSSGHGYSVYLSSISNCIISRQN